MNEKVFYQTAFFSILLLASVPFLPLTRLLPAGLNMTLLVFLMIVPLQGLLLAATLLPSVILHVKIPMRFPGKKDIRYLGYALLLFIGISLLNGCVTSLFHQLGLPTADQEVLRFALHCKWSVFFILLVSTGLFAPVAEELAFRFSVYGFLRQNGMGKLHAAVATSLLFALMHGLLQQSIGLFILGMFLQRAAESDDGRIIRPVLMHSLFNLCGMTVVAFFRITGLPC